MKAGKVTILFLDQQKMRAWMERHKVTADDCHQSTMRTKSSEKGPMELEGLLRRKDSKLQRDGGGWASLEVLFEGFGFKTSEIFDFVMSNPDTYEVLVVQVVEVDDMVLELLGQRREFITSIRTTVGRKGCAAK